MRIVILYRLKSISIHEINLIYKNLIYILSREVIEYYESYKKESNNSRFYSI